MLVSVIMLLLGLPLLAVAADHLVQGSARVAAGSGMSAVTIGVVVIGFGTSAPELLVSGSAAAAGHTGLAVGNLVGSNVINVTLVLGVAGLIAPVLVTSSVLRWEAPLSVGAVSVFAVLLLSGLDRISGVVLVILLLAATVAMLRVSRRQPHDVLGAETREMMQGPPPRPGMEITRTVLGLAGTLAGAQLLVTGGADLATRFGVSQQVVGFTVVAIGTSLPELVTTIQAQRRGEADLLVGNLLGSNLLNSLAGGAIVALTAPSVPDPGDVALVAVMAGVSGLSWALLARSQRLTRTEALALTGAYLLALPLLT